MVAEASTESELAPKENPLLSYVQLLGRWDTPRLVRSPLTAAAAAVVMEASRDVEASTDSELAPKKKPMPTFKQWRALFDTPSLDKSLTEDATSGSPLSLSGSVGSANAATCRSLSSTLPAGSAPTISPRSPTGAGLSTFKFPLKYGCEPVTDVIPQFYFACGRPLSHELKDKCLIGIEELFHGHVDGLQVRDFKFVTKEICKLPSYLSTLLHQKIDIGRTGFVSRDAFHDYWLNSSIMTMDIATQIFTILKQPDRKYLIQEDIRPLVLELLAIHPGLEFLKDMPEFQELYTETVIYRIFYYVNRSGNGQLTLRELKRGNLIAALQHADEEEDINKVLRYFSYEHFYVLYSTFWELDTDHDFLIDKKDLMRYGKHALSCRIVDRIFSQVARKFTSKVEGKMDYEDFVYFMLSEEDKSSEPSLEYWFKCIDLDGDGALTPMEMRFFYEEQLHRMNQFHYEPVLFEDILCQMIDMVSPENEHYFTLRDLKSCKLSGNVFNTLFNIRKFFALEKRNPRLILEVNSSRNPGRSSQSPSKFKQRSSACMINTAGFQEEAAKKQSKLKMMKFEESSKLAPYFCYKMSSFSIFRKPGVLGIK